MTIMRETHKWFDGFNYGTEEIETRELIARNSRDDIISRLADRPVAIFGMLSAYKRVMCNQARDRLAIEAVLNRPLAVCPCSKFMPPILLSCVHVRVYVCVYVYGVYMRASRLIPITFEPIIVHTRAFVNQGIELYTAVRTAFVNVHCSAIFFYLHILIKRDKMNI